MEYIRYTQKFHGIGRAIVLMSEDRPCMNVVILGYYELHKESLHGVMAKVLDNRSK